MLAEMVRVAETYAQTLNGQLVDDNRKPLSEAGIASILQCNTPCRTKNGAS